MKSRLNSCEAGLLLAPFLFLAIFWRELPARVPMHWNLHGGIDAWAPTIPGILLAPLLAVGLSVLLRFLPRLDPKLRQAGGASGRMSTALPIIRLAALAILEVGFFLQLAVSLGWRLDVGRILVSSTLVLLAVIGNYLGNLRPNYFAGIRTPWTLENPATWRATHRLGGRLIVFGALGLLLLQFVLRAGAFIWVFLSALFALLFWAFYYSWRHARTTEPEMP